MAQVRFNEELYKLKLKDKLKFNILKDKYPKEYLGSTNQNYDLNYKDFQQQQHILEVEEAGRASGHQSNTPRNYDQVTSTDR